MTDLYDTDRASPETVRALLVRVLSTREPFGDVVAKLRGECRVVPLRTEAEVAAELLDIMQEYFRDRHAPQWYRFQRAEKICSEPTRPAPSRTREAIALEVLTLLAGDAGCSAYGFGPGKERQLTFNVPDGVGGKELLDLLAAFNNAEDPPPSSHPANALTDHDRDARPEDAEALACPGCGRPMARVGGPGARRGWTCVHCNAAGDPEEDHPDACGCEEAESLKAQIAALDKQLAALRARNFDLAMQAGRIRKLARSHEVQALFEAIDEEP
jgi:hypothetical protein